MKFFELGSEKSNNPDIKSKVDVDPQNDNMLCDYCGNTILKSYQGDKMICPTCLHIYEPNWEFLKHENKESTIDEMETRGQLGFVSENNNSPKVTLSRKNNDDNQEPDYILRERQTRINRGLKLVKVTKG